MTVRIPQLREAALTPVPEEEIELSSEHKMSQLAPDQTLRVPPVNSASTITSSRSGGVSEALRPTQVTPAGVCSICSKVTDEYTEEVIALCVVAVGTCSHRIPSTVSGYLVSRIIPSISK